MYTALLVALDISCYAAPFSEIDHRAWNTGLPVRSAILKPCAGRLVVGWVTTSEYLLLIVFVFLLIKYPQLDRFGNFPHGFNFKCLDGGTEARRSELSPG